MADAGTAGGTYTNPLSLQGTSGPFGSCPDPAVIRGQRPGDAAWYLYCTEDIRQPTDRNARGGLIFRVIPTFRSADLVHWTYTGDAAPTLPSWVARGAFLWAPDIEFFNGRYFLYYAATATHLPGGGSAIGVMTSDTPTGPWVDSGAPVVEPQQLPCCPGTQRDVFDPTIATDASGQRYLFYGSFVGGISARRLSTDGLHTDASSETPIAIGHRYEGASVVKRGDFYYLFVSATNCCNGSLTGYSVFAGRSTNLLGPYTDREGVSLLAGTVGGTPVITMNGDRWVGTGHNTIVTDLAGQDWFLYHAIDRNDPYFAGMPGFSKRPVLLDRLDWSGGWPTVRGGLGASDTPQPAPATRPGEKLADAIDTLRVDQPGVPIPSLSDDFTVPTNLDQPWRWVRQPPIAGYGIVDGTFRFDTQAADLHEGDNTAAILSEPTPAGDYVVDTRVRLNVPPDGYVPGFVQAGLVIYSNDDNYVKLVRLAEEETRQTEFGKEIPTAPPGYPRYGNTVVGPPGEWTDLRIVGRRANGEETYSAYTSQDGGAWVHGGTWVASLGVGARIGLVAMGGAGYTAHFDYVHVAQLTTPKS